MMMSASDVFGGQGGLLAWFLSTFSLA